MSFRSTNKNTIPVLIDRIIDWAAGVVQGLFGKSCFGKIQLSTINTHCQFAIFSLVTGISHD